MGNLIISMIEVLVLSCLPWRSPFPAFVAKQKFKKKKKIFLVSDEKNVSIEFGNSCRNTQERMNITFLMSCEWYSIIRPNINNKYVSSDPLKTYIPVGIEIYVFFSDLLSSTIYVFSSWNVWNINVKGK